jgi:Tfp pilus assembly protein PilX
MTQHKLPRNSHQGIAIVILMIILIVATAIGIWGLTTSRSSLLKAGSRKFSTELTYQAEQGLQKAVRRIQSLADATATDQVAVTNSNDLSPGKTGGIYTSKTFSWLVNSICSEGASGCTTGVNNSCSSFNPLVNFDVIDVNVVCNFLGVVDKNNQVSIVRKKDLDTGTDTFAIFLVNSIATDSSGRKQAIQGVVVVPFSGAYGASVATSTVPYLASSKAVTD